MDSEIDAMIREATTALATGQSVQILIEAQEKWISVAKLDHYGDPRGLLKAVTDPGSSKPARLIIRKDRIVAVLIGG